MLLGFFSVQGWWGIVPTLGVVVAAIYLLWAYQRLFHGPTTVRVRETADLTWRERGVLAPLVAVMVLLGVYPRIALDEILPSVNRLLAHAHLLSTVRAR